ncbi:MbtH family protein [Embleya hyalina]|uniref:MbtH protein n=1 Tax=Embleya hyalina TaxID=516124 RepID=A0A401Z052_9ACTN|nr:MbtH family NRPS accessory protein [Embleya hyalina]GCE00245.1 MbtH protein [Embleya hyalina]
MTIDDEPTRVCRVVINDEDQYSVWAADRDIPAGWRAEGFTGPRADCLAHIDKVWTDMRPRSIRNLTDA